MDVSKALQKAKVILEEASLPEHLQPVAFDKILESLLVSAGLKGASSEVKDPAPPNHVESAKKGTEKSAVSLIAGKLGRPADRVGEVYFLDGEELGLGVSSSTLATSKTEATRQIAVLIAAGRQAAGLEESGWTPAAIIRAVCDHYGKFDTVNFGTTLKNMDDVFQIKGSGQSREVRVKVPGYERAAALVDQLTGNDAT